MFSVGVLYSSQSFLELVRNQSISVTKFQESFTRFEVAEASLVLELSQRCHWVSISETGILELTERGQAVVIIDDSSLMLREQLADLIVVDAPAWSKRIRLGRIEARKAMPTPAEQCFRESGLFESHDPQVVDWWDRVTQGIRSSQSSFNLRIGRAAERLTVLNETEQKRQEPHWQSIESNVSGYDVLSVVAAGTTQPLQIEVKGSSMRVKEANFFLSRHEWDTALNSEHYEFHLWLLHQQPRLFVVSVAELTPHVPTDGGEGRWELAKFAYKDFTAAESLIAPSVQKACEGFRHELFPDLVQ